MLSAAELHVAPNALARHYSRFRVADRLLLTGHSHQAWPDVALDGQIEAWTDAAEHVDEKWGRAEAKADQVRRGYARLLNGWSNVPVAAEREIALAQNTHELVVRFLSALPLRERPRIVTTDGEFHTVRRQLDRLAEARVVEVVKVGALPAAAIADRLAKVVDEKTAAVMVSSVLFRNAYIVPGLGAVLDACRRVGAELLVDAYHHLNAVPFSLAGAGLEDAFVVGGGYKYCQLGEGNAFLRVPPRRAGLRPVITGWFSEFERIADRGSGEVSYAEGPTRWGGATYEPTSHYRAARVFDFFEAQALTPELLREVSQHQIGLLASQFDALDLDPRTIERDRSVSIDQLAGFLALTSDNAGEISRALRVRGVLTDFRGDHLRLGPAPYLSDDQLVAAISILGEVARQAVHQVKR